MASLPFAKYHGIGNDFIIVDRRGDDGDLSSGEVVAMCNRHLGIGADGVLSIRSDPQATARMQIQNADGGEASMCGNGLRCVVRFVYDEGIVAPEQKETLFRVGEVLYRCQHIDSETIEIHMGRAVWEHPQLPKTNVVTTDGFEGTPVWFGNPHLVIFVDAEAEALARKHGPELSVLPDFSNGANISFARVDGARIETWVYERGAGMTQACGSGACAVAAAAQRRGLVNTATPIEVHLPGGCLRIEIDAAGHTTMAGPARRVFTGVINGPEP